MQQRYHLSDELRARLEKMTLQEKITFGMKLAIRRLYEQKAANNEYVVISDRSGEIKRVPAKDLLKDFDKD